MSFVTEETIKIDIDKAKLVWDEYKYRHGHCWKLVFQITAAVVIVSIIPYTNPKLPKLVVFSLPILAIIFIVLSFIWVRNELNLWRRVRTHLSYLKEKLEIPGLEIGKDTFKPFVLNYLRALGVLASANAIFVVVFWKLITNQSGQ